ncbi:uncharacterized protein LOC123870227 [Maniola jurtina]|uniref:uncharacterized protein LOC123870227 n=1 Tax=Maniola jurtina TaxID=191418 RepID=UPI001E68F485|nr:uncharacterized protein LOC123870227 [Maniola jurtina]
MKCQACNKDIERGELLSCCSCRSTYDYKCLNISKEFYTEHIQKVKRSWECPSCMNVTRRRNENTPVRNQFELLLSEESSNMSYDDIACGTLPKSSVAGPTQCTSTSAPTLSYDQFGQLLDSKIEKIRSALVSDFKKEFTNAIEKLKIEFTQSLEFISAEQCALKNDLITANKTIETISSENIQLKSEVVQLSRRLSVLEKSSRSRNIEIQLIPEKKNENLIGIFKNLCGTIKASTTETDVCSIRRVAKLNTQSTRPRNVIVTLPSERHRDDLISTFKRYNKSNKSEPLNSSHLGIPGEKHKIYVSEHLSPECKAIHAATRKAAKEHAYTYVWVRNDRVYTRKNDKSSAILIRNISDLTKITQ